MGILSTFFGYDGFKYLVVMYVLMTALGAMAFPWSYSVFKKIRGGPFVLSRSMGLLGITVLPWLASSVLGVPHSRGIILGIFLLALGLSLVWIYRRRKEVRSILKRDISEIVLAEIVFLFFLVLLGSVRAHLPEFQGTEKFMDYMLFRGLIRAGEMPPFDPWLAGETINYYYGGYLMFASIAKTFPIPPNYLINTAIPLIAGLAGAGAYVLSRAVTGSVRWGLLGPFMVCFMSNLNPLFQWLDMPAGKGIEDLEYFPPSRVIWDVKKEECTINEFPFFSFFHGDVHPHVVSIPFVILFLTILYVVVRAILGGEGRRFSGRLFGLLLPTTGICLGFLGFVNGLDLPVLALLFLFSLSFMGLYSLGRLKRRPGGSIKEISGLIVFGLGVLLVAGIVFYPFLSKYVGPNYPEGRLGLTDYKTRFTQMFTVWGIHTYLIIGFILFAAVRVMFRQGPRAQVQKACSALVCGAGFITFVILFAIWGKFSAPFFVWLIPIFVWLLIVLDRRPSVFFTTLCIGFCCGIFFGCEIIYIRDIYGPGYQRLNTLFKFYYQAWIMLGIVLPVVPAKLWSLRRQIGTFVPSAAIVVTFLLFAAGSLYAVGTSGGRLATRERHFYTECEKKLRSEDEGVYRKAAEKAGAEKTAGPSEESIRVAVAEALREVDPGSYERIRRRSFSLDGTAFIEEKYPNTNQDPFGKESPGEAEAIDLLDKRMKGTPVILEAPGTAYNYESRTAVFAGLPVPVGWVNHESIWRKGFYWNPEGGAKDPKTGRNVGLNEDAKYVGLRRDEVDRIYTAGKWSEVEDLLVKYRVKYIFVGDVEKANQRYKKGSGKFKELEAFFKEGDPIVLDDGDEGFSAVAGSEVVVDASCYQGDFRLCGKNVKGKSATWQVELEESGLYDVWVRYKSFPESSTSVEYRIYNNGNVENYKLSQRFDGNKWVRIGRCTLDGKKPFPGIDAPKSDSTLRIELHGIGSGTVTADAVLIKPIAPVNIYVLN